MRPGHVRWWGHRSTRNVRELRLATSAPAGQWASARTAWDHVRQPLALSFFRFFAPRFSISVFAGFFSRLSFCLCPCSCMSPGSRAASDRRQTRPSVALIFPDLQRYRVGGAPPSTPTASKHIESKGHLRSSRSGDGGQGSHATDAAAPAIRLAVSCHPECCVACGEQ